ncbi:MFS transporter [Micromonospora sp. CPCC 205556]|uniref:MFS transporter n=1 Tax=Micromonospora sp. CPCC 205556 TaxID=3122398 RepID=UPI002FF4220D
MSDIAAPRPGSSRLLFALACSQLVVALDFSIVYVALPSLGEALSFSTATLQWVVSAYAIVFAGFLLLGGRLVDAVGGGRLFLAAHALFALSSLAAGAADDGALLLAGRVGQGLAAALLAPATLALLNGGWPAGPARDRALAVWGSTGAVGLALGVVVGGAVLAMLSWRWVFWVAVPINAICVAAAAGLLRGGAASARQRLDPTAALLGTAAVVSLVVAATQASAERPSWSAVAGWAVVAVVLGAAVCGLQSRRPGALVPVGLWRVATLRAACVVAALYMASLGAEFYLVTLYLQRDMGMGTLAAGLAFLPLTLTIVAGNSLAGRLAGRWGLRRLLIVAFGVGAVGLGLLTLGLAQHAYLTGVLPGLVVSGLGQGLAFTGMFITGTRDLDETANGTGAALVTTTQYVGGAIGLALLVLLHGPAPETADFRRAFLATVLIAAVTVPVAAAMLRAPAAVLTGARSASDN